MVERVRSQPKFTSPVLITECAGEQSEICRQLEQEIKPRNIIERMYVADIASITFETLRYRRAKTAIINTNFRAALQNLLTQLLREPADDYVPNEAKVLALTWFTDEKAREQVSQILGLFHLDASAIEAEAIRSSSSDLQIIEGMLASLELRRTRALCFVAEYRATLAWRLKESADRIVDAKAVRRLEHPSGKNSAAA
jgi:hypothetical protein